MNLYVSASVQTSLHGHPLNNWCFVELGPQHQEGSTVVPACQNQPPLYLCQHTQHNHPLQVIFTFDYNITSEQHANQLQQTNTMSS